MNMNSFYIVINNTSTHMYLSNEKRIPITRTVLLLARMERLLKQPYHYHQHHQERAQWKEPDHKHPKWERKCVWWPVAHTIDNTYQLYFPSYLELCNCVLLLRYVGGRDSINCKGSRRCWKRDNFLWILNLLRGKRGWNTRREVVHGLK